MKPFMDQDFLLSTQTARKLYHDYASSCPIIDYHCHVNPQEIFEDKHFQNITQLWLNADHYKWRLMRSNGVDERYITGDASDYEKFQKFAEVLPKAIGNPMYHWCHLELKKYFGYEGILNGNTAKEVWQLTGAQLGEGGVGVRALIQASNVVFIGTTDDPVDSLEWHQKIAADHRFPTTVAPSFRPDKAFHIGKAGWVEYLNKLSQVSRVTIHNLATLKEALRNRMDFFHATGCKVSDHGLNQMIYRPVSPSETEQIMQKALSGVQVSPQEAEAFQTDLLLFCAEEYARLGWVMQIHYNCLRNPNTKMFEVLGADTGFDCIGPNNGSEKLAKFLDTLQSRNMLPKTILYSLDSSDNSFLDSLIGSFQAPEIAGKLQHGSAWWFHDHLPGMKSHLTSLASMSLLGNFVGMLTDSRSFLSYTRHEYFRRILCNLIGEWVENGEYPADLEQLSRLVTDICYHNAERYFGISSKPQEEK